jgi:hypothetical protein
VAEGRKRDSRIGQALQSWGYGVWNGCDEEVRRTEVPRNDEIRVVQYASMRGLEGWSTVVVTLDESYSSSEVAGWLRRAASALPDGVVEWETSAEKRCP